MDDDTYACYGCGDEFDESELNMCSGDCNEKYCGECYGVDPCAVCGHQN